MSARLQERMPKGFFKLLRSNPDAPIRMVKRKGAAPIPIAMYDTALTQSAYGQSGKQPVRGRSAWVRRLPGTARYPVPVMLYDAALTESAYGRPQMLGDLFNDVMGAVIPAWDQRPDWMKKIQVKPDPAKLVTAATKIVAPSTVGKVVDRASAYGLNLFYRTPAGSVPITGETAASLYGGYPAFARARTALESVPGWAYLAGGGVLLIILATTMRR